MNNSSNLVIARGLAELIEYHRFAALEAADAGLGFRAEYLRAGAHSVEIHLLEHARRCGLTLGPVVPRSTRVRPDVGVVQ